MVAYFFEELLKARDADKSCHLKRFSPIGFPSGVFRCRRWSCVPLKSFDKALFFVYIIDYSFAVVDW